MRALTGVDEPRITALAPWFGGKRNLAPEIVRELGPHKVYWEPFCGSMAMLLRKPACGMETVNDLHGDLVNLARVVADEKLAPRLYRRLRRVLMAEDLYRESAEVVRECKDYEGETNVERAYHYFVAAWLGRNGVCGTSSHNMNYCARYTANGGHAATRWQSAVSSIPAWHRRMRSVTILRRDAFTVLERIEDKPGTAIYVDPPYLVKGCSYLHDLTDSDHQRLADLLSRFRAARVVVSYYADDRLGELYPGWTQRQIDVSKALANEAGRGKTDVRATEVLLCNLSNNAHSKRLFA